MSKLSEPMIRALRAIAQDSSATFSERTGQALRRRFLIADVPGGFTLTPSGTHTLAVLDEIERTERERAERLSKPVPAGAFAEPSARTAPVLGHEYEDEFGDEIEAVNGTVNLETGALSAVEGAPEIKAERRERAEFAPAESVTISAGEVPVPESWIDQLVILLDAGARIVAEGGRWTGCGTVPFRMNTDRLDMAANEAIRRGIVRALPRTPGQGVVRLALVPKG